MKNFVQQDVHGKPSLLFVIDNLSTGGAQRQMVNLALGFKRRKYPVDIFCYTPGDLLARPLYEAGIQVFTHIKSGRFSPSTLFDLRRAIQHGQYGLVLSFLNTPNFYAVVAGRLMGPRRVPVVVSERSTDFGGVPRMELVVRQFYRFATHVTVNSIHQRQNFSQKYPFLRDHLSTIYNGYDLQFFAPASGEPNNQPLRILTIASVSAIKNGLCLIEALNILREKYGLCPQVDWIGQRVMHGDRLEYFRLMEGKLQAYNLQQQWHWLDQRTDVVDQYHQHDVLVHPSAGEGLPNVVCEALSCARPVIVSNTLDHVRLVQNGENGLLFDWQEPADLADKVKQFIDMPVEERRRMGLCGRRFAEENLSQERLVDEYERLFTSLL